MTEQARKQSTPPNNLFLLGTSPVIELLNTLAFNQIVIFVKSVRRCSAVCKLLTKQKFVVTKIHCEMPHEEYFVYL